MHFPVVLHKAGMAVAKNSPAILTTASVVGVVVTVVFSVKATTKAEILMADLRRKQTLKIQDGESTTDKIPTTDIVKTVGPVYVPTIIMGSVTIACILGAAKISSRRNAVLAGLYSASEFALKEYQKKIIERVGEKEHRAARDEIAQDRLNNAPVRTNQIILTGKGNHLCCDSLSGRYFRSDIETIRRVQNDVNRDMLSGSDMWVSLNEVYDALGLEAVELGRDSGWDVDQRLDFDFSSGISTDGEPCLMLMYANLPHPRSYGY